MAGDLTVGTDPAEVGWVDDGQLPGFLVTVAGFLYQKLSAAVQLSVQKAGSQR